MTKVVEMENRKLKEDFNRVLAELQSLRDAEAARKPRTPLFFDSLYNEMPSVLKSAMVRDCEDQLKALFKARDTNLESKDPDKYKITLLGCVNELEKWIYRRSGYEWKVGKVGDIHGSINFHFSGTDLNKHLDCIDINFAYPGQLKPTFLEKDAPKSEQASMSPTPNPVAVKTHVRIYRRDLP